MATAQGTRIHPITQKFMSQNGVDWQNYLTYNVNALISEREWGPVLTQIGDVLEELDHSRRFVNTPESLECIQAVSLRVQALRNTLSQRMNTPIWAALDRFPTIFPHSSAHQPPPRLLTTGHIEEAREVLAQVANLIIEPTRGPQPGRGGAVLGRGQLTSASPRGSLQGSPRSSPPPDFFQPQLTSSPNSGRGRAVLGRGPAQQTSQGDSGHYTQSASPRGSLQGSPRSSPPPDFFQPQLTSSPNPGAPQPGRGRAVLGRGQAKTSSPRGSSQGSPRSSPPPDFFQPQLTSSPNPGAPQPGRGRAVLGRGPAQTSSPRGSSQGSPRSSPPPDFFQPQLTSSPYPGAPQPGRGRAVLGRGPAQTSSPRGSSQGSPRSSPPPDFFQPQLTSSPYPGAPQPGRGRAVLGRGSAQQPSQGDSGNYTQRK